MGFDIRIMLLFMVLPIAIFGIAFLLFKRKTMNILHKILPAWNKRYVVCHLKFQSGLGETHLVVPNPEGLTCVAKYSYMLREEYSILTINKRLHYILDENNSIPKTFDPQTKETVIFQASVIQKQIDTMVMDYLFSRKKEMLIMGLFVLAAIAILVIVFNIISINELKTLVQAQGANIIEVAPK